MYALGALPDGATDNYPACSQYINETAPDATKIPAGSTIYFPAIAGTANNYLSSSGYLINRSMNLACDPGVTLTLSGGHPYAANFYMGGIIQTGDGLNYPAAANVCNAGTAPLAEGNTTYTVSGCSSAPLAGQTVFLGLGLDNHDFAMHMVSYFTVIQNVSGSGPWTVTVKDPLPREVSAPDWSSSPHIANALIRPKTGNPGNFIYQQTSGIDGCVPGATRPGSFNEMPGGSTIDGTCLWTNEYTQSDFPTVPTFSRSPTFHELVVGLPGNFSVTGCTFAQLNDTSIPYDPALYFGRTYNVTVENVSVTAARILAYFIYVEHGTVSNVNCDVCGPLPAGQLLGFGNSSDFNVSNFSVQDTMGGGIYIESYSHDLHFQNGYLGADPNQQTGSQMFGVNGAAENITADSLQINMGRGASVLANPVDIDSQALFTNTELDGADINAWDMRWQGPGQVKFNDQKYQYRAVSYQKTYRLRSGLANRKFPIPSGLYASVSGSLSSITGVTHVILGNSSGDAVNLYQASGPAVDLFPANGGFGDLRAIVGAAAGGGSTSLGRYADDALQLGEPSSYPFNYHPTGKYVRFDTGTVRPGTKVVLEFKVFVPVKG
jgi:hypothetical protein